MCLFLRCLALGRLLDLFGFLGLAGPLGRLGCLRGRFTFGGFLRATTRCCCGGGRFGVTLSLKGERCVSIALLDGVYQALEGLGRDRDVQ